MLIDAYSALLLLCISFLRIVNISTVLLLNPIPIVGVPLMSPCDLYEIYSFIVLSLMFKLCNISS